MIEHNGSLLTKYRPKTFGEVIGQSSSVKATQRALAEKTARTFMFFGPPGTGKTSLARVLADTVGCKPANYTEVNAANITGVDGMRDLINETAYSGLGGSCKVVVLDEAQRLSAAAWSCLLKPMEEPPRHVYWVVCTTDPGKIPKANLTRCVQIELKAVRPDDMLEWLGGVAEAEGWDVHEDVLYLVAQKADGSPRQALANLVKCHACKDRKAAAKMLKEITVEGDNGVGELCKLLMSGGDWAGAMQIVKSIGEKDNNPEGVRQVVLNWFTKIAMDAKDEKRATAACAVLDAFGTPYPPANTMYPVILSLGTLLL